MLTDQELWDQAHTGVNEAASLIALGWVCPTAGQSRLNKMQVCLRDALCAVQELERRAAGVPPQKEGA